MRHFAELIQALDSTNKTNSKIEAILHFLDAADDQDKLQFLVIFTRKKTKRAISTNLMKDWVKEIAGIPDWLFVESYSAVGDLGETMALLIPEPKKYIEKSLNDWTLEIKNISTKNIEEKKNFVVEAWLSLPFLERFIFNKLIGGNFRIGVSSKTLINALAKYYNQTAASIAHRLMGNWNPKEVSFNDLINGDFVNTQLSNPYPFCLAYPLEKKIEELGSEKKWQAEYKWDGIRGQLIRRNNQTFIWSRGEEMLNHQFPELLDATKSWKVNVVLDGEILVLKEGKVLNFTELQKRLNRKSISKKILADLPIVYFVYDVLEIDNEDIRNKSLHYRRKILEDYLAQIESETIQIPAVIDFDNWNDLAKIREHSRQINSEGLMLKNLDSFYHTGRKKGDWWKWKLDPLTIDAVLIYAQKGSGKRSGFYTDYTFAVKNGDELVTITKAYSGLSNVEIQEVSKFVNTNAIEKFGPVKSVKPELVFEIAFEGIGFSSRHKSGVALRFPRIVRWRKDKSLKDIDQLEEIKKLIR